MRNTNQNFETRQYMVSQDFEFFHYINDSSIEIEYHNHDFYEIFFFISGKVTYMIEGKSYRLRPGDILLISSSELHKPVIELGQPYERMVMWIKPDFIKKQSMDGTDLTMCFEASSMNKYNLLRADPETFNSIRNVFIKFSRAWTSVSFGSNILKSIYLTELIVLLNKAYLDTYEQDMESDIQYNVKVSSVIQYINDNLGTQLSLDLLADKFFLTKYHLLREFKKHAGYTIHQYIQQKRLIYAKQLLRDGYPVTEVCSQCGFGDYSNFIRAFKKAFGLSPKQYYKIYL